MENDIGQDTAFTLEDMRKLLDSILKYKVRPERKGEFAEREVTDQDVELLLKKLQEYVTIIPDFTHDVYQVTYLPDHMVEVRTFWLRFNSNGTATPVLNRDIRTIPRSLAQQQDDQVLVRRFKLNPADREELEQQTGS